MTGLLASPRGRRRFAWLGGALLAVAAVGTALVLSDPARQPPERLRAGTAPPVAREVRLTAAMRRGIDRTLAEFVPAAVGRENPARAWQLAGPGLRAGGRLREWKTGLMPVQPYAFAHRTLRDWRLIYARSDRVAIDLMLFPRAGSREGPIMFGIDLVPRKRGWLVDSIFPAAIWSGKDERPFVTGAQDFTAKFGTKKSTYDKPKLPEARLSAVWLLVPGLILGASLVAPLVIFARGLVSRRRRPAERMPAVPASFSRRP
ncbi:MAG TPA: hypothetical protein VFU26_02355 [Gaiellaceae bacterium]|nr:hypothetical protein [Gaiellaceae bacterium]